MRGHDMLAAAALASLAVLAACSDPKAPSEANFRKALEPTVADAFCRTIDAARLAPDGRTGDAVFPLTLGITEAPGSAWDPTYDGASVEMLDTAARSGLLTRTEAEQAVREPGDERPAVRRRTATYAPTTKGAQFFRPVVRSTGNGPREFPAVCGAKGEIVDVARWTEPADMFGRRISQVTYTYRGVDPLPTLAAEEKATVAKPKERTVAMELASDGWRVMSR